MKMMIKKLPPYEIAFIRQVGAYGIANIQAMEQLKNWAKSKHLLNDQSIILGIPQDNPETTKPENCRYDTCLVISQKHQITDDFISMGQIAGASYAVFQIEHTPQAVQQAWNVVFLELIKQGYQLDDTKPIIERYTAQMVKNHKCEICVPIREVI